MAFEEALYDVFGPGRAGRGMSSAEYAPAFGEEALAAFEGVRPRIIGKPRFQVGRTGIHGSALTDYARGLGTQASASGDLGAGVFSQQQRAMTDANIQLGREKRAADLATFQQQARTRGNIAAAGGEAIEAARGIISNPQLQDALSGAMEDREAAMALREDMAELQAPIDESVGEMARIAGAGLQSRLPRLSRPGLEYRGREPLPSSMEQLLARIPRSVDRRDIQGDSDAAFIGAIEEDASDIVDRRFREKAKLDEIALRRDEAREQFEVRQELEQRRLQKLLKSRRDYYGSGSGVVSVADVLGGSY